jgi:cation diffusion facilitator CzcD-associated flavoprotein CzcO
MKDAFRGIVMHSKDYKSPDAWKGKNGVVVGAANTGLALVVCADY